MTVAADEANSNSSASSASSNFDVDSSITMRGLPVEWMDDVKTIAASVAASTAALTISSLRDREASAKAAEINAKAILSKALDRIEAIESNVEEIREENKILKDKFAQLETRQFEEERAKSKETIDELQTRLHDTQTSLAQAQTKIQMLSFENADLKKLVNKSTPSNFVPDEKSQLAPFFKYKIVLLGNSLVGKTSIITRFMYDTFDRHYQPTIGIGFKSKTMDLPYHTVRLEIWDATGQGRFRSLIIPSYIRDSSVAIVVYDVSNRQSFLDTTKWIQNVRDERGCEVLLYLVGNKLDTVPGLRQVSTIEGQEQATRHGAMFTECSAESGVNVKSFFQELAAALPSSA